MFIKENIGSVKRLPSISYLANMKYRRNFQNMYVRSVRVMKNLFHYVFEKSWLVEAEWRWRKNGFPVGIAVIWKHRVWEENASCIPLLRIYEFFYIYNDHFQMQKSLITCFEKRRLNSFFIKQRQFEFGKITATLKNVQNYRIEIFNLILKFSMAF